MELMKQTFGEAERAGTFECSDEMRAILETTDIKLLTPHQLETLEKNLEKNDDIVKQLVKFNQDQKNH